jgi:hypothetical protein
MCHGFMMRILRGLRPNIGLLPKHADGDFNASGYQEDRRMAGDLAAEHSLASTADVFNASLKLAYCFSTRLRNTLPLQI